ncbi:hypothetical protein [Haemophilus haemolyticus]|uniref:hypothetical protein n=1 Tax=Haemophilus haemolyticus TaxID=726 RepID=UPI00025E5AD9|nr:hypothetical protein [Haemophilus haemolyticus]EIJ74712.1 hypothetical protein HMPREF1053_0428 [Haemophilus haemolyticus HK386]OBX38847.1 hypothetical protein A8M50_05470 [Haemophilus haemolyticus]
MEENFNQLLTTLSDSAVGQWWTEYGLWVALLAPLAYVIICCIVSNSSEKRVYFYSYLDVFLLFIPVITFFILPFLVDLKKDQEHFDNIFNWSLSIVTTLTLIFSWIFSWRANQGNFLMTLFMFIGKWMYLFVFWIILLASIALGFLLYRFADENMKRKNTKKENHLKRKKLRLVQQLQPVEDLLYAV